MKRGLLYIGLFVMFGSSVSFGQNQGFGLGIILGEPTGISAKGWVSGKNAVDVGLAWSFRRKGSFHLHADYLWHFTDVIKSSERFVLYAGLGGRLAVGRGDGIVGMRLSGGFTWWPRGVPLDIFLEIAPILDLAPATELSANGGIGVRYYF